MTIIIAPTVLRQRRASADDALRESRARIEKMEVALKVTRGWMATELRSGRIPGAGAVIGRLLLNDIDRALE